MYINDVSAFVYSDVVNFVKKNKQPRRKYLNGYYPSHKEEDGFLKIRMSTGGMGSEIVDYCFPLISLYANENKNGKTTIAKAIALVPPKPKSEFGVDDEIVKLYDFAKRISITHGVRKPSGSINSHGSPNCILSVDRYCKVIRFGAEDDPYQATNDEHDTIPIFSSKGHALKAIVDQLRRNATSTINLVGMDIVNMNSVPNSLLEEMSFVEVPDLLGRGVSMWQGDPVRSITGGSSSYSFRSSWNNSINREVADSFISLLEAEFNTVKKNEEDKGEAA
jgi:hypothetical protein